VIIINVRVFSADLKWLIVRCSSSPSNPLKIGEEDSVFLTDDLFIKVFSLMPLDYLDFKVNNAKVIYAL
jgi:hypothetical protein